jgi:hypothetical protein
MIPFAPGFFKPCIIGAGGCSVSLLIHPIDNTGNTYTDSSGTSKTVTETGSDLLEVANGGRYGNLISVGGGDTSTRLIVNASPDFEFEGDFTIAAWINIDGSNLTRAFMSFVPETHSSANSFRIYIGEPDNFYKVYVYGGSSLLITSSSSYSLNTWTHLAVTRKGSTLRMFLNGVNVGETTYTATIGNATSNLQIFGDNGSNRAPYGQFEDILIVKDKALYFTNFTPPVLRYNPNLCGASGIIAGAFVGNSVTAPEGSWGVCKQAGPTEWYSNPPAGYFYEYKNGGGSAVSTSTGSYTKDTFSISDTYFITAYNPQVSGDYGDARLRFLDGSDNEIIRLEMYNSSAYTTKIRYSTNGGSSWTTTGTTGGSYPLPRGELTFTADSLIFTAKGGNFYAQGYCTDFTVGSLAMSTCTKLIVDNVKANKASEGYLYPKVFVLVGYGTGLDTLPVP